MNTEWNTTCDELDCAKTLSHSPTADEAEIDRPPVTVKNINGPACAPSVPLPPIAGTKIQTATNAPKTQDRVQNRQSSRRGFSNFSPPHPLFRPTWFEKSIYRHRRAVGAKIKSPPAVIDRCPAAISRRCHGTGH